MCPHCGELSHADLANVVQEMRFSERKKKMVCKMRRSPQQQRREVICRSSLSSPLSAEACSGTLGMGSTRHYCQKKRKEKEKEKEKRRQNLLCFGCSISRCPHKITLASLTCCPLSPPTENDA
jgi:hypothetical protein